MKDRKKHVIERAHQLFIEKGFQNTSIQEILDYSGISKGTFYNYFSSKSELLIAIFKTIFGRIERERDQLLLGQDPEDIETFSSQIEMQMRFSRANKLLSLYEEVFVSNDDDLKEFLKRQHMEFLRWVYLRFIDVFGESKEPYLLDCAIMFWAILNQNLKFHTLAEESNISLHKVVSYTVRRIEKMVEEVAHAEEQLISPEQLDKWLPDCDSKVKTFRLQVKASLSALKIANEDHKDQPKFLQLLTFIEDELFRSHHPRIFLIESVLLSLTNEQAFAAHPALIQLDKTIKAFYQS